MYSSQTLHIFTVLTLALAAWGATSSAAAQDQPLVYESAATLERDGRLLDRTTEQPITGTVVARHPDGRLSQRYAVRDGRADGAWLEWYDTGAVRAYLEWKAGLGDGVWVYFHPNGEVSERSEVRDDIWHGPTEGWHANGVKAFEGRFDRGVRPVPSRRWNDAGQAVGPWVELRGGPEARRVLTDGWTSDRPLWDFALSPDLETLFVATGRPDGDGRQVLIRRWRSGAWTAPEPAPFADPAASEGMPAMAPDGRHVYFSSDRHKVDEPDNPNRELYRASAASGWRTVERVTTTPAYGEVSLSFNAAGDGVLWTGRRPDGEARMGLYEIAMSPENPPTLSIVRSLNDLHVGDPSNENSAAISPDGRFIVFANYDVEGPGQDEDLYLACRLPGGWGAPQSLGSSVNTSGTESSPQIIDDGRSLVWRHESSTLSELRVIALGEATRACGSG